MASSERTARILRNTCARCAQCCIEPVAPVTEADVRRLMRASSLPAARIVRFWSSAEFDYEPDRPGWVRLSGGRRVMGLRKPRGRCIFLGPDGGCRVYESRPMTCRTFPFEVTTRPDGSLGKVSRIRMNWCRTRPGTGVDPAQLAAWSSTEDAEDEAYHRRVERWNRMQRDTHPPGNREDFLRFLGLAGESV